MFKWFRKLLIRLLIVCILLVGICVGYGYVQYRDTITLKPIDEKVSDYWRIEGYLVFSELNEDFVNAVVSVEDKRFFKRTGFDYIAFSRAMFSNVKYGTTEGGSTITQQVAKNLFFSQDTDVFQKISEVFVMFDMEEMYTKEQIFALYVNMNYYGDGYWGIRQASLGYFKKPQSELTLAEAAMLAGLPNAPSVFQLSTGYDLAKERQETILDLMVANGYITKEEAESAKMEVLK